MEDEAWKRELIAQFQGSSPTTAGGEVVSDDHHGGGESAKRDMPPGSEMSSSQLGTRGC